MSYTFTTLTTLIKEYAENDEISEDEYSESEEDLKKSYTQVRKELKNYSKDMLKKDELVAV